MLRWVCLALALLAQPLSAATIVVEAEAPTFEVYSFAGSNGIAFPLGRPITVGEGDVVDLTLRFTNGRLFLPELPSVILLGLGLHGQFDANYNVDATFYLLDQVGNFPSVFSVTGQDAGFQLTPLKRFPRIYGEGPLEFGGIRVVFRVNSAVYVADGTPFPSKTLEFGVVTIGQPVPEPQVWALWIAGFLAAGISIRARRRVASGSVDVCRRLGFGQAG